MPPTSVRSIAPAGNAPLSRRASFFAPAAAAILAILPASASLAQPNNQNRRDPNELITPQPTPPSKTPSTWVGTLVALGLGGVVLGVNCIPSKRGHQD